MLKILAAAVALPVGVMGLREFGRAPAPVQWQGEAMGAPAQMTLWHPDPGAARRTLARVEAEIVRFERVFSLYRSDSEIVQLNSTGRLAAPSRDLVAVLELAREFAELSGGAFNPALQPLWRAYSAHFSRPGAAREGPDASTLARLRPLIRYQDIDARQRRITLARIGMALSLNGIAKGHLTDRITDLLRNEGFDHAMVEVGETAALGAAPDGQPFTVHLMDPAAPGRTDREIELADAALSVSGGYGMRFSDAAHHIFDPSTGRSAERLLDVVVIAPRALAADALSTAIFVAGEAAAPAILAAHPGSRGWLTRNDGSHATL